MTKLCVRCGEREESRRMRRLYGERGHTLHLCRNCFLSFKKWLKGEWC